MSHTPGPWEVMLGRDKEIRGLRGKHGPVSVNIVNWNGFSRIASANGQANARLIAAAPELLAFAELIAGEDNGDGTITVEIPIIETETYQEMAARLVKKARGQ